MEIKTTRGRKLNTKIFFKNCVLTVGLLSATACGATEDAALQQARKILSETILVDGHNDLPWAIRAYEPAPGDLAAYDLRKTAPGDTDIQRLRSGGVGAQFWSVYTPGEGKEGFARTQLEQIELASRMIARYPEALTFARSVADIRQANRDGKVASLLGIEGGHAIENSLGVLRAYYDLGVRYMTLTHNTHTDWADSAAEMPARHHGLNTLGEQIVTEMNRIGMLIDLSHTSAETVEDTLRVSKAPVIFSHSAAKFVCDVPRNISDDLLLKVKDNGGIVMVTFVAGFIDPTVAAVMQPAIDRYNKESAAAVNDAAREKLFQDIFDNLKMPVTSIAKVADHIEHIRDIAGVKYIGIGGDFDGNSFWPEGLSDVSMYPNLFAELIRRGWQAQELKMLAGENLLRVMAEAEAVAASMQSATNSAAVN
jgi:membrane dipeptidase